MAKKKEIGEQKSFVLYYDSKVFFDKLSNEEAGQVIKSVFNFQVDGVEPEPGELSLAADIAFSAIQNYLIRDKEAYIAKCIANSNNAKHKKDPEEIEEDTEQRTQANASERNRTYTDSDNDNDSDPVNEPVNESVSVLKDINGLESKPCSKLDFNSFSKVISKAYANATTSYSLESVLDIFKYYFDKYHDFTGNDHPALSQDTVTDIIFRLEYIEDENEQLIPLDPSDYEVLIDRYFEVKFPDCDRNICHFMSGNIRLYRYLETLY